MHDQLSLQAPSAQAWGSQAHFPGACPVMEPSKVSRLGLCLIHLCAKLLRKPVAGKVKFPKLIHVGRQPLPLGQPGFSCLEVMGLHKRFVCLGDDLRSCTSTMPLNNSPSLSLSCSMLCIGSANQNDVHEVPIMYDKSLAFQSHTSVPWPNEASHSGDSCKCGKFKRVNI